MGFAQKDILFNEDQKWKLEQDVGIITWPCNNDDGTL